MVCESAGAMLKRHRGDGLDGIEAYYGQYDAGERARWIKVADALDLVCTAGSDRHTPDDLALGIDLPSERASRLREWLGV